ncbi:MAG: hypothetical protein V7629_18250 [Motiliproteus sp.]
MTSPQANKFIDPSLSEAIQHWKEYSDQTTQDSVMLMNAMTPLKDSAQVAGAVFESMQQTDWLQIAKKLTDPTALSTAIDELSDIQIAVMGKVRDGYRAFLQTSLASAEQLAEVPKEANSAATLLATLMETSLNIVKQYQQDASDEAANLNAIQAAYRAWFQKSLQTVQSN